MLSITGVVYTQDLGHTHPVNEYRFTGGTLVCITDSASKDSPLACLHIGPIRIGARYEGLESRYGNPVQSIPNSNGRIIQVFHLISKSGETTYLAITVREDSIDAIQIAGAVPDQALSFSSVTIGDSPRRLIQVLGVPSKASLVEENGATLWSYTPFPFSFEILQEKVSSIKLWKP